MNTLIIRKAFQRLAILLAILAWTHSSLAQAPFRPNTVVIGGAPKDAPAGLVVVKHLPNANLTIVRAPAGGEKVLAAQLRKKGFKAGINRIAHATASVNDPFTSFQWNFNSVQANSAWDISTGTGVVVAVLDTGLATNGSTDGIGCAVPGIDIVNGDSDPTDGDGHGTHVSGTIAQATNNGIGVAGLAFGSCVMPVKVLDDNGSGSFADIADGIYYAVNEGASVINMSLGVNAKFGIRNDPIMDAALDYAYNQGVTVVCAAGNDGHRKNVSYPAIYPTTIAVGATDFRNRVPRYSNKGEGLDLVAPGGDNSRDDNGDGYADGVLQETVIDGVWGYYFFDGTSMASPHVAAAAALLISEGTASSPLEVLNALTGTAKDLGSAGFDSQTGWGLLQVHDALSGPPPPPPCTDADGDGWCIEDGDCDDTNPAINPGATEVCGDGIDNNCDGVVDEGCDGPPTCTDNDGDGWCIEDGDCDDNDPDVHPGHPDRGGRWGRDNKDNDCNGIIDG